MLLLFTIFIVSNFLLFMDIIAYRKTGSTYFEVLPEV
jgi:hypothetical protein